MSISPFDLSDDSLFGTDAAEAELSQDVFLSYFYKNSQFQDMVNPGKHFIILNAYKGEGKSALLRAAESEIKNQNFLTIRISASDLNISDQGENYDAWIRAWRLAIISRIGTEIGKIIGFAWKEDDIIAVEQAERLGARERNVVGIILDRFNLKMKKSGFEGEFGKKVSEVSEGTITRLSTDRPLWLFLDESDVNFVNTVSGRFKVAGLLTAARRLFQSIPTLRVRTTVRPTTWTALYSGGVEDMTHVREYLLPLQWQAQDIRNILAKRVEAYLIRTGHSELSRQSNGRRLREEALVTLLFGDDWPWSKKSTSDSGERPPHVVLSNLSKDRPRWLVELCKEAAKVARSRELETITKECVIDCLADFGRRRMLDLKNEFYSECALVETILNGFSGQKETYKTDQLLHLIKNRITEHSDIRIVGEVGRSTPMQVAHFLFKIGFLTARMDNSDGSYEHYSYSQKSSLLRDRANPDQGCSWEIHPIFRQALNIRDAGGYYATTPTHRSGKERR